MTEQEPSSDHDPFPGCGKACDAAERVYTEACAEAERVHDETHDAAKRICAEACDAAERTCAEACDAAEHAYNETCNAAARVYDETREEAAAAHAALAARRTKEDWKRPICLTLANIPSHERGTRDGHMQECALCRTLARLAEVEQALAARRTEER